AVGASTWHPVLRDAAERHVRLHQSTRGADDRASTTVDARRLGQRAIELHADRGIGTAPGQVDSPGSDDLVADPGAARAEDTVVRTDLDEGVRALRQRRAAIDVEALVPPPGEVDDALETALL